MQSNKQQTTNKEGSISFLEVHLVVSLFFLLSVPASADER